MSVTESSYRDDIRPTTTQEDHATELSDADYPPVYGEPVFEKPGTATAGHASELEAITEQCEPSTALVDNDKVGSILKSEGFGINNDEVKSLNIFPSPMDAFQYALYSFGITDIYIVLMINIRQRTIYGYHILDLTQNYSLVDDLINRLQNKDFLL
ncbi:MAG: hypothetical protein ACRBBR_16375 [Cellvibrionaceae bacterium]